MISPIPMSDVAASNIGVCSHGQPEGRCALVYTSGCAGPPITIEEAIRRGYEQGFNDGFVSAHVDESGFPDEAQVLRQMDGVAKAEGWGANRDALLAVHLTKEQQND